MKYLILFLFTLNAYATFTALPSPSPPSNAVVTKGGLLSSDGSAQAEFGACTNGQVLQYDSGQTLGLTCGNKTVDTDTNASTICTGNNYLTGSGVCKLPENAAVVCAGTDYLAGNGLCTDIREAGRIKVRQDSLLSFAARATYATMHTGPVMNCESGDKLYIEYCGNWGASGGAGVDFDIKVDGSSVYSPQNQTNGIYYCISYIYIPSGTENCQVTFEYRDVGASNQINFLVKRYREL